MRVITRNRTKLLIAKSLRIKENSKCAGVAGRGLPGSGKKVGTSHQGADALRGFSMPGTVLGAVGGTVKRRIFSIREEKRGEEVKNPPGEEDPLPNG